MLDRINYNRLGVIVHGIVALIPLAWWHGMNSEGSISLPSVGLILWCVFLGILPDIDTSSSVIGSLVPEASRFLERNFGHRTLTHSLFAIAAIAMATWFTDHCAVLTLAYASHIFTDMIVGGRSGVSLFWPIDKPFSLFHIDAASPSELMFGLVGGALVLIPLMIPALAVQANAIIPQVPTPTPTKTPMPPTPTPEPIPTLVSVKVQHVFDINNEILVNVGDVITAGVPIADLGIWRENMLRPQPTSTATHTPLPTSTPIPQATQQPIDQAELARAWADLEYARAVATRAFEPVPQATLDACQSKLEQMRNELWADQLARDALKIQALDGGVPWERIGALEANLMEQERQIAEQETHCIDLSNREHAKDEYDLQVAAAALQRAEARYWERVATYTPYPTYTPQPTSTPPPTPTYTPVPDVSDTVVYSPVNGDVHAVNIGVFEQDGADVLIDIAIGYGYPPTQTVAIVSGEGDITVMFTKSGIDVEEELINRINAAQEIIDIASFEFNLDRVADALIAAQARGVTVRFITDDEYGLHEDHEPDHGQFARMANAGIEIRDDGKSALMHNKFWIFDRSIVWTGSTNITINGTQKNNNNVVIFNSPMVADIYLAEFAEMWHGEYGSGSPSQLANQRANVSGTDIEVLFGPEDNAIDRMSELVSGAQSSVRFMAFSFTHDTLGNAMMERSANGVDVQGIFEARGSKTQYSELGRLHCAGVPVRTDGNSRTFHHKVIVIDESIVVSGSFNFSKNADERNDENAVVIYSAEIAGLFVGEFDRRWGEGSGVDVGC